MKDPDARVVDALCDGSSGDRSLELRMVAAYEEAFALWKERHLKYGRDNISRHGAVGCLIRGDDKSARLSRVYIHGSKDSPDESIADSWLDMLNYAAMGLLCHRGEWPVAGQEVVK